MPDRIDILKHLYDRFNARDIDAVLASLHPDVVWANGMEGGHVHRHEGIREYWTRQWSMFDPHVDPIAFSRAPDGAVVVEVHQVVHDLEGKPLFDGMVGHIFRFVDSPKGPLVKRFDIREESA